MTAPNIDMIAAFLRSCTLEGGRRGNRSPTRPPHLAEASDESAGGITVDLNSDTALPYHWEQCLDMRTGEIYYINWETGVRTTDDPRTTAAAVSDDVSSAYPSSIYYDDGDGDVDGASDEYSCSRVGSGDDDYDEEDEDDDTADSSSVSSAASPTNSSTEDHSASGSQVLVAAGCKACFMYFMVPKRVDACPKCGGTLLHLGRNGCV
ncbi:hypothetical protein Cni_G11274 [Canna indica]|uniref:WW domain-containing protein n=1 Tax=Canna indica TaxID=4628 RepID=A0AAQ3K7R9_9LILI|nr:hypothetical protein Cni_G11274 [Canna indica]